MSEFVNRRNGRYSYRRRYPKDIAESIGRIEFTKALGTSDPKEAARLARLVSVEFDRICKEARAQSTSQVDNPSPSTSPIKTDAELAASLVDSIPQIMLAITQSVLANQVKNPDGTQADIEWRRKAALDHLEGRIPWGYARPPMQVHAMLKALDLIDAGTPYGFPVPTSSTIPTSDRGKADTEAPTILTQEVLDAAIQEYSHGKSHRRVELAKRCIRKCIRLPCNQTEARDGITNWCTSELSKKSESSVATEVTAVISLLKFVSGWHDFSLPKYQGLKQLRGANRARKSAKSPVPVPLLQKAIKELPPHLPRGGGHWHAALILCAIYGFRPGELLQSGEESLINRKDTMGKSELVFRVGIDGAKNEASKRDVPVLAELEPLFRLATRPGSSKSETTRTRVERLNRLFSKALGKQEEKISLYSIRHTFADVARNCGYSDTEFGPIMGHQPNRSITSIYGGNYALDKQREILSKVQATIFPEGLNHYIPKLE